jgi:hypothetical protein
MHNNKRPWPFSSHQFSRLQIIFLWMLHHSNFLMGNTLLICGVLSDTLFSD